MVLNPQSEIPLYRQVFEQIAAQIRAGELGRGGRLPATRELAGQLGLNRTTVSAAYALLEAEGLIAGQVGRGSFVTGGEEPAARLPALQGQSVELQSGVERQKQRGAGVEPQDFLESKGSLDRRGHVERQLQRGVEQQAQPGIEQEDGAWLQRQRGVGRQPQGDLELQAQRDIEPQGGAGLQRQSGFRRQAQRGLDLQTQRRVEQARDGVNWGSLLDRADPFSMPNTAVGREISFVMSRPSRDLFPLDDFRASCEAVLKRRDLADILQLGSPSGYEPLRRHLLEEARAQDLAGPGDDLIVTNGCQQALDLIARVLLRPGDGVAIEDPVYPGLKNLLAGMGAQLMGIPVGADGMDMAQLERAMERERPRFIVASSNFQNPTGATLPESPRRALLQIARAQGVPVVENDAYGELRYAGEPVAPIKQLDRQGGTVLLRSFSKISFPGLRVGWALGPRVLIERMRHAKEASDLHTDQLSQAVLLEFAESGRLAAHRARVLQAGAERLRATLEACRQYLPAGTRWTKPEGGMNVWVRLREPLDAAQLLPRAREEGMAYLPGRYFAVSRQDAGALRLSFAGLPPEEIRRGVAVLGRLVAGELEAASRSFEPAPAMV